QPHAAPVVLAMQRREAILHGLDVRAVIADEHDRQERLPRGVACGGAARARGQAEVRTRRAERDVAILSERHGPGVAPPPARGKTLSPAGNRATVPADLVAARTRPDPRSR